MRIKDVEKRILASLENNDAPLNPHILDKVKEEIKKDKKPSFILKYAVSVCLSIIVCLAIVIPIVLIHTSSTKYQKFDYSSMRDYVEYAGIQIKTYDQVFDDNVIIEGESNYPYIKTDCEITKLNKEIICIEETYVYINGDKINMFILLSSDDNIDKDLFSEYMDLDKEICISGINVEYNFDTDLGIGKAGFSYSSYRFYVNFNVQSEDSMVLHLQTFINLQ
jgi:hypothetical protein